MLSFLKHFLEDILFQTSSYFVILLNFCAWLIKGEIIHASKMIDHYQSHYIVVQIVVEYTNNISNQFNKFHM